MLSKRSVSGEVTPEWLAEHLTKAQFSSLMTFYIYGPEADDPKAV